MGKLDLKDVVNYVEKNIEVFHQKRIQSLDNLKLTNVLKRKNPYLFKAKHVLTSGEIVKGVVDAHISSNEETIFGDWLEGLAIFINQKVLSGWKSGIPGIDLEFDKEGIRYIVTIKSGPNWGNSRQIAGLKEDFKTAKRTLRTSNSGLIVTAVNGCCYGKDNVPDKGEYYKYCGQKFWNFISEDNTLYTEIIEPLGHQAKNQNDKFLEAYAQMVNKFDREFIDNYVLPSGEIDWTKIVELNSKA